MKPSCYIYVPYSDANCITDALRASEIHFASLEAK